MKKVRILVLLLAALLLFSSCGSLPTLKKKAAGYVLSGSNEVYAEAPTCYLAARRSKEAVALLVDATGERPLYSAGEGLLCDESGELFAKNGTLFPALKAFAPSRLNLCKEEVIRTELATSMNETILQSIVSAFETDALDPAEWEMPQGFATSRYLVLLLSKDYSDFCFKLEYYVIEKGDDPYEMWDYDADHIGILYNRYEDLYAMAPSDLYTLLAGEVS